MAFPTDLTNAIDNNTDIVASIINNIEEKIGINGSADINSLDFLINSNRYNVMKYGALGNGSDDDAGAIQDAINAANSAGGGTIFFPRGTYKITTELTLYSHISLIGIPRESIIDLSAIASTFNAFTADGVAGSNANLTGNADKGDNILAFNTSGFADDDWIKLQANYVVNYSNIKQGEIMRIDSVDNAGQVTAYDRALDNYTTANTAQVHKMTFVSGITIEGLDFLGTDDNTIVLSAFNFDICRDIKIKNCIFNRMHYYGISFKDSIFCNVLNCGFYDSELAGYSYGVMCLSGSQDINIIGCHGSNLRHMLTVGGSSGDFGLVRRIAAIGNNISQCEDAGLDSHSNGEDCIFANNTISGANDSDGIVFQGTNCVITGNVITGIYRHGILIQPLTLHSGGYIIANNIIRDIGQYGINISQTDATYGNLTRANVSNNTVENVGMSGAYGGIYIKSTNSNVLKNIVVSGNTIRDSGGHMITLQNMTQAVVNGNALYGNVDAFDGIRLGADVDYSNISNNSIYFTINTDTDGIVNIGGNYNSFIGNVVNNAKNGIYQDNSATYCMISGNNLKGCTVPLTAGSGTGHVSTAGGGALNLV
jgi:hypothetical protein